MKKINKDLLVYNIKSFKAYFLVFLVGGFASFPLTILINRNNLQNINEYSYYNVLNQIPLVVITILFAITTPFLVFNYLNSKKSIDVYHALPIKKDSLFITQTLSTLILIILPFVFNYTLGNVLLKSFGIDLASSVYIDMAYYALLLVVIHLVAIFVIMNTGTVLDSLIYIAVVFFLPMIAFLVLNFFLNTYIYGFVEFDYKLLNYLAPLYAIFYPFGEDVVYTKYAYYWITILVVLVLTTIKIYQLRPSEKAEEPFTNNYFYPIIISVLTPTFFILMKLTQYESGRGLKAFFNAKTFLIPVFFTFVFFTIADFLRNRSSKNFMKSTTRFIVIMLVTVLIAGVTIRTQVFGYTIKLPARSEIKEVVIDQSNMHYTHPILNLNSNSIYDSVIIDDEKTIDLVYETHTHLYDLIKKYGYNEDKLIENSFLKENYFHGYEFEQAGNYYYQITISYILKNGNKEKKTIELPLEALLDFTSLLKDETYQKAIHPILNNNNTFEDLKVFNQIMEQYEEGLDVAKLREAYFKDLNDISLNDLVLKKSKLKYILSYRIDQDSLEDMYQTFRYVDTQILYLPIDDRFVNTINVLDSLNLSDAQDLFDAFEASTTEWYYQGAMFLFYGTATSDIYSDEFQEITDLSMYKDRILGSHISKSRYNNYIAYDYAIGFSLEN